MNDDLAKQAYFYSHKQEGFIIPIQSFYERRKYIQSSVYLSLLSSFLPRDICKLISSYQLDPRIEHFLQGPSLPCKVYSGPAYTLYLWQNLPVEHSHIEYQHRFSNTIFDPPRSIIYSNRLICISYDYIVCYESLDSSVFHGLYHYVNQAANRSICLSSPQCPDPDLIIDCGPNGRPICEVCTPYIFIYKYFESCPVVNLPLIIFPDLHFFPNYCDGGVHRMLHHSDYPLPIVIDGNLPPDYAYTSRKYRYPIVSKLRSDIVPALQTMYNNKCVIL